ncbi:cysteine dioxygenase type I [Gonapodya prolifera JEL478]|uniref:Cysteine dioxygenase n=1 Tax=Gonapodya prolifera (strain JEL478) TaxID=1344416 RepID=A0A139AJQ9_GONPJ|nr:cysteine dioxygenase type I [Gonapodya prolifera JEL478]|eukprot:KXS17001.1 cysteine dioxygenase type I [Gonapodya prolifera JEL478]
MAPQSLSSSAATLTDDSDRGPLFNSKINDAAVPSPPGLGQHPRSFAQLAQTLRDRLSESGEAAFDLQWISEVLGHYPAHDPAEWKQYVFLEDGKYTRNLVESVEGCYALMVLCWAGNAASPIHDHPSSHCVVKVLEGELIEERYEWPEGAQPGSINNTHTTDSGAPPGTPKSEPMKLVDTSKLLPGRVAYIHDSICLHRLRNPHPTTPAVTLHLYVPPYHTCRTFVEATGEARAQRRCAFWSRMGVRNKVGEM